ncbi:MAG: beta-lactamase family protein [Calditrichaeota bacterium]|nr:beta-lactamase family protein [Calditrichota bacterium]
MILIISIFALSIISCNSDTSSRYTCQPPDNINDGLNVGTLDEVNIDSALIVKAVNKIQQDKYEEVHSMLIYKDNKLVFEEYFKGHQFKWDASKHHDDLVAWDRNMLHNIMSATKSVTSVCVGIAIEKGFIKSVHQSIFDYLPEHQHLRADGKEKITIEHLLTMTSGLEWREWSAPYSSSDNPNIGIWYQDKDPITYILEKPPIDKPGTSFNYSSGNTIVLGEIIRNATKMTIDEFSYKYLFKPLGIDSSTWAVKYENGVDANNLKITPRDMAKIGVTFLNNGIWNGKQIIPEQWFLKSTRSFPGNNKIKVPGEDGENGYSYSWWVKPINSSGKRINMFYAMGWGGQYIMVIPKLNTVVVFTGGNYTRKSPAFKILKKYIIPAIEYT